MIQRYGGIAIYFYLTLILSSYLCLTIIYLFNFGNKNQFLWLNVIEILRETKHLNQFKSHDIIAKNIIIKRIKILEKKCIKRLIFY